MSGQRWILCGRIMAHTTPSPIDELMVTESPIGLTIPCATASRRPAWAEQVEVFSLLVVKNGLTIADASEWPCHRGPAGSKLPGPGLSR